MNFLNGPALITFLSELQEASFVLNPLQMRNEMEHKNFTRKIYNINREMLYMKSDCVEYKLKATKTNLLTTI